MVPGFSFGSPFEEMAGYSRAVVDGDMVYVSGTIGYDVLNKRFPSTVEEQATPGLRDHIGGIGRSRNWA